MSLVSYAASSDEDSENDECEPTKPLAKIEKAGQAQAKPVRGGTGTISDDEDYAPVGLHELKKPGAPFLLLLPKPKAVHKSILEELEENLTPTFAKLPMPKAASVNRHIIEEEDDEFLRKKAVKREKPPPPPAKCPVKITIPSLKEFSDVDKDLANKVIDKGLSSAKSKGTGLLGILPKAKSERNFVKTNEDTTNLTSSNVPKRPAFIPDTVKNRRPAHNTEGVDGFKATVARKPTSVEKLKIPLVNCSDDSEESDDEEVSAGGDFFSLNAEYKLPEVSTNEINAMVAKRAAKMAEATTKYLDAAAAKEAADTERREQPDDNDEMMQLAQKRYHERQLDGEAMQALVGGSAKRRRKQQANIQVMDISSDQVLPDREEWMRTALASSTTYQPTGVLTDEEPAAGTRRKHQITYLAHKAKANEAELQAMWATNRQNRRATQSKYGF